MASKPLSRGNSTAAGGGNGPAGDAVNVQVILRCRPPSKEELASRAPQVIKCNEALGEVFGGDTSQEKLYVSAVSSIVEEVLDGFSCTIFAYGQTGTGKTHTMTGEIGEELTPSAGVIPRAIHQIFAYLEGLNSEYTVKCSYLELYNEEITDLLAVGQDTPKVRIMEDRSGVVLAGIEESIVRDSKEIFALLEQGSSKRRTAETLLNKQSSRSHSVFVVTVSVREITPEGDELIRVGKLYLVDLAGSENITRSGAVDQRAKEAGNINKSLLTLGRVITALVEGQGHVPYRDSKLTRLLRDSLGGRTKTCIIATIAPTVQCQEETLSTLDYAHRAKNIKNKPEARGRDGACGGREWRPGRLSPYSLPAQINAKISKTTHLKEMNVEIEKLKAMLLATREKNGVYIPAKQYEEECEERRTLGARVEALEAEAEAATAAAEAERTEWEGRLAQAAVEHERQMGEVRAELAVARAAVAERDYAIDAQRRCEGALAAHAGQLNAALRGAAADIALLFRRVDEKNALEDANTALVAELREAATARLAALEGAIAAAAAAQAARFAEARRALGGLRGRKGAEAVRLGERLAGLQRQLDAVGAGAAAAAAALAKAGADSLQEVDSQQSAYLAAAQAAATEAAATIGAAHEALGTAGAAERDALAALVAEQEAATAAVHEATGTIVSAVRGQLQATAAAAAALKSDLAGRLEGAAGAATTFKASFAASVREEQAALLQQIGALLGAFVDKTGEDVAAAMGGLSARLVQDRAALEEQLGGLEAGADGGLSTLATNEAAEAGAHAVAAAALQAGAAQLGAAMEASEARGAELRAAVQAAAGAAASALEEHAAAASALADRGAQALADLTAAEQEKSRAAVAAAAAGREALATDVQAAIEEDKSAAGQLDGLANAGAAEMAAFATAQAAAAAELACSVQSALGERYQADGSRDAVPAQRECPVPATSEIAALRAPEVEQLFATFRLHQQQGEGDAAEGGAEPVQQQAGGPAAAPAEQQPAGEQPDEAAGKEPMEAENQPPAVPAVDVRLPAIKAERVTSPTLAGTKRGREAGGTPISARSPSKLRNAFEKHITTRRRG
eukprot:scaffold14.g1275.t1